MVRNKMDHKQKEEHLRKITVKSVVIFKADELHCRSRAARNTPGSSSLKLIALIKVNSIMYTEAGQSITIHHLINLASYQLLHQ